MAGVMMAQRYMSFTHPFSFEFKRLAYDAVGRGRKAAWSMIPKSGNRFSEKIMLN
jgi:hypothetical protein